MRSAEKRNELTIHGIFILAAMVLCLVSTVTFALAAEGDEQHLGADFSNMTPAEIQKYLAEHANEIPPDVLAEMKLMANDPLALEALASEFASGLPDAGTDALSGGIRNLPSADGVISNFPSDAHSNSPFVEGAAFTLPPEDLANMTPEELSDYQLMQDAMASGNREVMDSLMEKYGHEEGEHSEQDFFIGNEHWGNEGEYNDMNEHAGDHEYWEAMYQEWEADGGAEAEHQSEFVLPEYEQSESEPYAYEPPQDDVPPQYEPPQNYEPPQP